MVTTASLRPPPPPFDNNLFHVSVLSLAVCHERNCAATETIFMCLSYIWKMFLSPQGLKKECLLGGGGCKVYHLHTEQERDGQRKRVAWL